MKEKLKNKKIVYTIIGIISVLLIALGITYAFWLVTRSQSERNIATTACLEISLTDEKNDITLSNQFPISDEEGMELTPYEFTITNNCNTDVDYRVTLEAIGNESEAIKTEALKVSLDGAVMLLGNGSSIEPTTEGAYESRIIGVSTLAAKGEEGDSKSHTLKIWIDKDAPTSEMKKTFRSKISVSVGEGIKNVGNSYTKGTLAYDIITSHGGPSSIQDLSGEWELYKVDSFQDYLHQGDYSNNYLIDETNGLLSTIGPTINYNDCFTEETTNYDGVTRAQANNCYKYAATTSSKFLYEYKQSGYYWYTENQKYSTNVDIHYAGRKYNKDAGTGLYKAEDDLGTSYYYRGNVENNYVKLIKKVWHEEIIPAQEVEEAYIASDFPDISTICEGNTDCIQEVKVIKSMIFTSEEDCITVGKDVFGSLWTSCEKQDEITELYFSADVQDEPFSYIGYLTEEDCTTAGETIGWTTCEKREFRQEATPEIDNSYYGEGVDTYWRIVRVNGDGTIRLVYDGDNLYENGTKHNNTVSSISSWYSSNISGTNIEKYIEDSNFCMDTDYAYEAIYLGDPYDWYEHFANYYRIKNDMPSLICGHGDNIHTRKVGVLSIDEAAMAGALGATESKHYLQGSGFITSSPSTGYVYALGAESEVSRLNFYYISDDGKITEYALGNVQQNGYKTMTRSQYDTEIKSYRDSGRPVINLKADVPFTGSGTIDDPYVIGE